jgi:very-short-patch-repair endonuclease
MSLSHDPRIKKIAREICRQLRKSETRAEKIFWQAVRGRKFHNLKFYHQYPIYFDYLGKETFYVADFYCYEKKLIVELDGKIHNFHKNEDQLRTEIINMCGIKVIRFQNEVVEKDIDVVLKTLWLKLKI